MRPRRQKCLAKQCKQQLQLPPPPTQPCIAPMMYSARTYGLRLKLIFLPLGSGKSQKRRRRARFLR